MTVAMLYRRIIMIIVAMSLFHHPWLQVSIFVACSLFMLFILVIYRPYRLMIMNCFEIFNEFMIISAGYLAMTLVGFMRSPIEREACGVCMIWVIRIHIALNVIYILYGIVRRIILYYKRFMLRRRARQRLIKQQEIAGQVARLALPLNAIQEESKENQNVVDEESIMKVVDEESKEFKPVIAEDSKEQEHIENGEPFENINEDLPSFFPPIVPKLDVPKFSDVAC